MAILRMLGFHLMLFSRTTYFVQLLTTSTLSILALLALAAFAYGTDPSEIWLRSGMVGAWMVTTVAAGLIGFQRHQGTLVHLVMSTRTPASTLLPLVASASTFGVLAFPLAAAVSTAIGMPPAIGHAPTLAAGGLAFWLGCLALSCSIAALFVLTPNAMTYEGLLAVPLVLLSGVVGPLHSAPSWVEAPTFLLPTSTASRVLLSPDESPMFHLVLSIAASAVWFLLARWALGMALRRATERGTLEIA